MNSSALQPLPSTSFDLGADKSMEYGSNMSNDCIKYDEVFEEDKENICLPSSPLNYLPSSPFTARKLSSDREARSPPYRPSPPHSQLFNEESQGSVSSSPKYCDSHHLHNSLNINISPLKHEEEVKDGEAEDTPNISPTPR